MSQIKIKDERFENFLKENRVKTKFLENVKKQNPSKKTNSVIKKLENEDKLDSNIIRSAFIWINFNRWSKLSEKWEKHCKVLRSHGKKKYKQPKFKAGQIVKIERSSGGNLPGTITKIVSTKETPDDRKSLGDYNPKTKTVVCEAKTGYIFPGIRTLFNKPVWEECIKNIKHATEEEKKMFKKGQYYTRI